MSKKKLGIVVGALIALALVYRIVWGGVEPAVGLYWTSTGDPTAGGGVCAPLWQLLIRTDTSQLYYKSGSSCTEWTAFAGGGASGISGSGTANAVAKFTAATVIGSSQITDDGTTTNVGDALHVGQLRKTWLDVAIAGAVNDWNPTGLATATAINVTDAGEPGTITGIAGGADGRRLTICDVGSTNTITLSHESASSAAANRLDLAGAAAWRLAGATSPAGSCIDLVYRSADSRWHQAQTTAWPTFQVANAFVASSTGILLSGTVDAASNAITNLLDPSNAQDAATKNYTDTHTTSAVNAAISGTANTLAVFTGTNSIGNSGLTDNGTLVSTASRSFQCNGNFTVATGSAVTLNSVTTINQQLRANGVTGNNSIVATFGATNQSVDVGALFANNTGTFNTTASARTSYGVQSSVTSTRVTGTNALTNIALYGTASGAQTNEALVADAGDVILNQTSGTTTIDGAATFNSTATFNGNISTTGNQQFGNGAGDTTTVTGSLAINGVAATQLTTTTAAAIGGALTVGSDATLQAHVHATGTAPAIGGCGTGSSIIGSDTAFRITGGSSGVACTITFHTAYTTNPPICTVSPEGSTTLPNCSISTTAITCGSTIANTVKYDWLCVAPN